MAARNSISPDQFGTLYHGTSSLADGATELDQSSNGGPRYGAMHNSVGWNYATNDLDTARNYAQDAARIDTQRTGVQQQARVFQVAPRNKSSQWGPDPDSGPNGWHDGPQNKREAFDLHDNGSEVSLRFQSPLKIVGGVL